MNLETTEEELMHTIFPHPTLSEMMKEAVLDAYGRAITVIAVSAQLACECSSSAIGASGEAARSMECLSVAIE